MVPIIGSVPRLHLTSAVSALAVGTAVALLPRVGYIVVLAALLLLPLIWRLASRHPDLAIAFLVLSQLADGYAVATPLVNLSARTALIVALVAARHRAIVQVLRANRSARVFGLLLLLWWLMLPLRAMHMPVDSALRLMVTQGSFIAVAAMAATLAGREHVVRYLARAAASVLLVLGAASLAANYGFLPQPERYTTAGRLLFGIESPFARNYGLNVPFDALALLVPLAVPFYFYRALAPDILTRRRLYAAALLASVSVVIFFLFQARGMLLQIVIAGVLTAALVSRRTVVIPTLLAAAVALGAGLMFQQLADADAISSDIRAATNRMVIETALERPGDVFFGTNEHELFYLGVREAGWAATMTGFDEGALFVHNVFLQNLASGGFIPFILITSAHILLAARAWRLWREDKQSGTKLVLLVASVLVLVVLNFEPVRANILGSWIVIGLVFGWPDSGTASRARIVPMNSMLDRTGAVA